MSWEGEPVWDWICSEHFEEFGFREEAKNIFRGPDGIEFPIFNENKVILQGLPMVVAHLFAGARLQGFFTYSRRHGQWVDGICVSGGDPVYGPDFIKVLINFRDRASRCRSRPMGLPSESFQFTNGDNMRMRRSP